MKSKKKHSSKVHVLGVITGGGDCPGLNAAIRAVVRRAGQNKIKVLGIKEGFKGLYEGNFRPLDVYDVAGIVSTGGTLLGTSRFNPFKFGDAEKRIKSALARKKIDCLINIGGEGTMRLSNELHRLDIPCIGVPKTIDNDIFGTDVTFGFNTAVQIATDALDRLHTTAESHNRVMILEVMGRHAGWIAAYAGIAGGADAVLIPEQEFSFRKLLSIIRTRRRQGKKFSLIVVSEDAKIRLDAPGQNGELLRTPMHHDEYGKVKLGGISALLEESLGSHLDMEVRSTVLGYIQRGGSPTAYDRILATRLGVAAVELAIAGKFGQMVALNGNQIRAIRFAQVVKKLKVVDQKTYQLAEIFFG